MNLELAIDMNRLLDELAATHPRWCAMVEMKCFSGLTDQEAAQVLGIPLRTVQHMWRGARSWLYQRLEPNATT